jgi:hypothetical protein
MHFVTKAFLYFRNLRKILRLMILIKSTSWTNFCWPLHSTVDNPKGQDQRWSGHRITERYTTNLMGTIVEHIKKSKSTHPIAYTHTRGGNFCRKNLTNFQFGRNSRPSHFRPFIAFVYMSCIKLQLHNAINFRSEACGRLDGGSRYRPARFTSFYYFFN